MKIHSDVLDDYRQIMGAEFGPFALDLVDSYLEDVPELITRLSRAKSANDADLFIRSAHSLKSNSQIFGAMHLAEIAAELEQEGLGENDISAQSLEALEREFDDVRTALLSYREELLQEA